VYLISSIELAIKNNGHLLKQDAEGEWTFGQTLALIPLIQVAKET
jgi:hypothetical protein